MEKITEQEAAEIMRYANEQLEKSEEIGHKIAGVISPFKKIDVPSIIMALEITTEMIRKNYPKESEMTDMMLSKDDIIRAVEKTKPSGEGE